MSEVRSTRNYFAHGGNELVIGGKLTFLPGATVEGGEGLFDQPAGGGGAPLPDIPDSTATTVSALREDHNMLLRALRESGLMAAVPTEAGDG